MFDEDKQDESEQDQANKPAPESILSMSIEHMGADNETKSQYLLDSEMRKVEDAINHSSLRKPTEYSASVDN